jgi:ubiquinol-cytochrome c reductase cytochrome c subunit
MNAARAHRSFTWLIAGLFACAAAALVAGMTATRVPSASAAPDGHPVLAQQTGLVGDQQRGQSLYLTSCASCHGTDGKGVEGRGPTLKQSGAASADFYLTTGRMPASAGIGTQSIRKPPAFDPQEIADLVAYVASISDGPPIPTLDPDNADLALGQQLYTANCAGCHNSAGSGGALGQGFYAPALTDATPVQVAEAIRIGPGAMPSFGSGVLDEHALNSIVRYVDYLREPTDRGGFSLGRIGPVTEGLVAWLVGMTALLVAVRLIGARH